MISNVGQQQLAQLVKQQGRAGLESLVQKQDVAGLKQAGLSELDARALLSEARQKGLDAVVELAVAFKAIGGATSPLAGGQRAVAEAGGRKGAAAPSTGGLPPMLAARGGVLDGVDPAKVKDFNLRGLALPREIVKIADEAFAGRSTRAQFSGYSAPPSGTPYAENTAAFVAAFTDALGANKVGLITSPTADKGSIDAITTIIGQDKNVPVLSITAQGYVDYIDPSKFPDTIDKAAYAQAPKYVFGSGEKYNQATALASNAFVATGGRDVTVFDCMRALEKGNPVVLVVDRGVAAGLGEKAVWDADKNRVNNGAAYLAEQITEFLKTGELKHPVVAKDGFGSFDKEWLDDGRLLLEKLVKIVTIDGPGSVPAAAAEAAAHVGSFTQPSAKDALAPFAQTSVADIKDKFAPEYQDHGYRYAALTSSQLSEAVKDVPGGQAHVGEAKRLLDDIVHRTVRHFGAGKYGMLDEADMNKAAMRQHAGYVAGELSRKLGLDEKATVDVLVPFYDKTAAGASPEDRARLASDLQVVFARQQAAPGRGQDIAGEQAAIKAFVTDDNNGWMFNQYGFGDADKALNRPGVYAGQAVLDFAKGIAGSEAGAKALLERSLNRSATELAAGLARPRTTEDVVAQLAARAAQTGWLVSKAGQGLVEASHSDPKKAEKGLSRFAPRNDLITDFDSLAAKKGWVEVAKDIDQVKTFLRGAGVLA